jgi:hypothetical protein
MIERSWMRFLDSLSENLKSKTCTELRRSIENRKWLGLSVIAFVLVVLRLWQRRSSQRKSPA